jgi:flavorubredoxin
MNESPIRMIEPELVAPDTWVVRQIAGEGMGPTAVYVNSSVILGEQPVLIDCGPAVSREVWLETTFSLVDPADVRWIFLSHDDVDHTGNLAQVLELCPNATLVMTAFMMERMGAEFGFGLPLPRMRWVNDGDVIDAGDRQLVAVTPPVFDCPTTRGLFDTKTRTYWAADAFGCPIPYEITDIAELDPGFWREGSTVMSQMVGPWLRWVDPAKFQGAIDVVRGLDADVITSGHGPALRGAQIGSALNLLAEVPYLPMPAAPGQADLDAIVAMLAAAPAPGAPTEELAA